MKNALAFISRFEEIVAHEACRRHVDGVVCGHIHTAEIREFSDVTYYNDGDWVEGCTALMKHHDGRVEILHWAMCAAYASSFTWWRSAEQFLESLHWIDQSDCARAA